VCMVFEVLGEHLLGSIKCHQDKCAPETGLLPGLHALVLRTGKRRIPREQFRVLTPNASRHKPEKVPIASDDVDPCFAKLSLNY
jgi:hypothetical protein